MVNAETAAPVEKYIGIRIKFKSILSGIQIAYRILTLRSEPELMMPVPVMMDKPSGIQAANNIPMVFDQFVSPW